MANTKRSVEDQAAGDTEIAVVTPTVIEAPAPSAASGAAAAPAAVNADVAEDGGQRSIAAAVTDLALRYHLERDEAVRIASTARTVAEARSAILASLEQRSPSVFGVTNSEHNRQTMDNPEARRAAMADAIVHRLAPGSAKLSDAARQYRHMSLIRMAEDVLDSEGVRVRGLAPDEIAKRALQTTSDFSNILSNVLNKRLRQSYDENVPSYTVWARRAPNLMDFKPTSVVKISNMPDLLKVNEHGEFSYGSITDGAESYKLTSFGRIVGVTRQVLINDDLRAIDRVMTGFSGAARRLENRTVYAQLTANAALSDGVALFHATHGNLAASGAAISIASLSDGRKAMRKQKGQQGEELNIAPRFLIGPTDVEQLAYQYTSSNFIPAKSSDVNEFRSGGRTAIEPVIDAVLDGSSTTAWYLAADNNQVDTIEYCYLEGADGVVLEQLGQSDYDGARFKARLDFVAKAIDSVGLWKNPGA